MATSPQLVSGSIDPARPGDWLSRTLASPIGRLALPSLSDLFFVALIIWLFVAGGDGWQGLLLDGDCGWHIRTGEYILDHKAVPKVDLYSFTKGGHPWFAWEWLADVWFGLLFRWAGLKGVVLAAGITIAAFATILLRRIFAHGANLFAALVVGLLAVGSASIHYLARPHIFTLLLLVIAVWMIEADRKRPSKKVWLLIPLMILWTNLHGGFLAFLAVLGALVAGTAVETWMGNGPGWRGVARYGWLTAACGAASVVNPYGIQLHVHIQSYLRSDWIRNVVQEFQSPSFRSENLLQFEVLLFAGLLVAGSCLRSRRIVEALWILGFGHMALGSVRHVPLFVTVAAPIIAAELTAWWRTWSQTLPRKSVMAIVEQMSHDLAPGFRRNTVWIGVAVVVFAFQGERMNWPKDFPSLNFPTGIVRDHAGVLNTHRVFSVDQWGDYLIFNNPARKVFIDGRSDFYGPALGDDYLRASQGHWQWRETLDKYSINAVLAPPTWALGALLKQDPGWRVVADDGKAILFVRQATSTPLGRVRQN